MPQALMGADDAGWAKTSRKIGLPKRLIPAGNRDDDVRPRHQPRTEFSLCRLHEVGLAAIEPDVGGRLASQAAHEPVHEAPAFGRLERHLERLAPHAGQRGVGQFQMTEQVANPESVIGDLEVGELLHPPERDQDGATEYRHRDERHDLPPLVQVEGDEYQPDDEETAIQPFAIRPPLGRVTDREAAASVLGHRASRTVPVRSIRWSAPSKYVSRLGCAVSHCQYSRAIASSPICASQPAAFMRLTSGTACRGSPTR